jgi:hypothetical protein
MAHGTPPWTKTVAQTFQFADQSGRLIYKGDNILHEKPSLMKSTVI